MSIVLRGVVLATCLFALTACDSSEERAEKHYQNALKLLEAGDVPRAILEFRNTLALDDRHRDARLSYARAALDSGNTPEAYANYLRIAEEFPEDIEARQKLSEIAILAQNWDEAERHGKALVAAGASGDEVAIVEHALAFHEAAMADDKPRVRDLTQRAEELAARNQNDDILVRVLIEGYLSDDRIPDAIAVTDAILESDTNNPVFYQVMAELLIAKGDTDRLEGHFRRTIAKFPDDEDTKGNLISLLVAEGRGDQAEQFLREEIEAAEEKLPTHVSLIALIRQLRGDPAALEEIEVALTIYDQAPLLKALKAGLVFDAGDQGAAIALMQSITDDVEPSAQVDDFKVTLAKMLIASGNEVGARQLVEAVLEHNGGHVEALKLSATWQIENDEAGEAIETLRLALDGAPEDAEAMTIMARAHERNGETQLAQDLLALAVEASRNAPEESLRFARVQLAEERYSSAEEVLINALRRAPGQPELLATLGQVYLATADWSRAEQVINSLRSFDVSAARVAADDLQLQLISQREGRESGIGFLEALVRDGSDQIAATVALIQARLQDNRSAEALELATKLAADNADDPRATMVLGNTHLALGDLDAAETIFRSVLEQDSANSIASLQLIRTLSVQGRLDEAKSVLSEGLAASPENPDLLWAEASFREQTNDFDGAIEVYEQLYALNTDNLVVANNLASLLVTYRSDDASLERAAAVGKRLRGTEFAPFQDTYGWLLYRQDVYSEAVSYLEPAARALTDDPIVQYHLGKAYLALERPEDALAQFEATVELAEDNDPRTQIAEARSEVERLSSASE